MRVLHYSHDYYGAAHLQKTLALAEQLAFELPDATQLLMTGSPQPFGVKLPKRVDYIKLPNMDESSKTTYHAPSLSLPSGVIKTLRETLILNAIRYFKPDVVFVQAAQDARGEIRYGLDYLQEKKPETKVVVAMGDLENTTAMIPNALAASVTNRSYFLSASAESCEAGKYPGSLSGRNRFPELAMAG